jgi:hypothetical protein
MGDHSEVRRPLGGPRALDGPLRRSPERVSAAIAAMESQFGAEPPAAQFTYVLQPRALRLRETQSTLEPQPAALPVCRINNIGHS